MFKGNLATFLRTTNMYKGLIFFNILELVFLISCGVHLKVQKMKLQQNTLIGPSSKIIVIIIIII